MDQYVGRFEVAVHDPHLVSVVQRRTDWSQDVKRLSHRERRLYPGDLQAQVAAIDVIHQYERQAFGLLQPIKSNDISMLQADKRLCFTLKIAQEEFVFCQVELQQFQRQVGSALAVPGFVDVANTAPPQKLLQIITTSQPATG